MTCFWLKSMRYRIWFPKCPWQVKCTLPQNPMHSNRHTKKFRNSPSNTGIWVLEALNIIFWKHMTVWGEECLADEKWSISNHRLSHFWIGFKQERPYFQRGCVLWLLQMSQSSKNVKVSIVFEADLLLCFPFLLSLPAQPRELIKKIAQRIWERILLCLA